MLIQGLGLVLFFAAQVFIARCVGEFQYGLYTVANSWLMTLVVIAKGGYDLAILRFGGRYWIGGEQSQFRSLIQYVDHRVVVYATSIIVAVLIFWMSARLFQRSPEFMTVMLAGLPIVLIGGLTGVRQSTQLAAGRMLPALSPEFLVRPLMLTLMALSAVMLLGSITAFEMMLLYVVAALGALLVAQFTQASILGDLAQTGAQEKLVNKAEWRSAATGALMLNGTFQVLNQADLLVGGYVLRANEIAGYSAAKQIGVVGLLALTALQAAAAPRIAAAFHDGRTSDLRKEILRVSLLSTTFSVAYVVVLFLLGSSGLSAYGDAFRDARWALLIIGLCQVVNTVVGPAGMVATMLGLERQVTVVYCAVLLGAVPLYASLARMMGGEGLALGVLFVTALWGSLINAQLRRRTGISTTIWRNLRTRSCHP